MSEKEVTEQATEKQILVMRAETLEHIAQVQSYLHAIAQELMMRGTVHDRSKLREPEIGTFARLTPKLKKLEYGTQEYSEALKELGPALKHHYENNSHHPEHYENGIADMTLVDVIEMFCDWMAATKRMKDGGDMRKSVKVNQQRFNMPEMLTQVFLNTIEFVEDWDEDVEKNSP